VDDEEVGEDEEGTYMAFKQCQILPKHTHLTKMLNHKSMCTVIVNVMMGTV